MSYIRALYSTPRQDENASTASKSRNGVAANKWAFGRDENTPTPSMGKNGDTAKKPALGDIKNIFATPSQVKEDAGGSQMKMKSVSQINFARKNDTMIFTEPQIQKERFTDNEMDDRTASSKPFDWCLEHEFTYKIPMPDFSRCFSPLPPPSPTKSDFGDLGDFIYDDEIYQEEPCLPTRPMSFDDEEWLADSPVTSPKVEISEQEVLPVRSLCWLDEYFEKVLGKPAEKREEDDDF